MTEELTENIKNLLDEVDDIESFKDTSFKKEFLDNAENKTKGNRNQLKLYLTES